MASIDVRSVQPYGFKTASGIAFLAELRQDAILADPLTKGLAVAMFADGHTFIVDGDDRHFGYEGKGVLKHMPFLQINDILQVEQRIAHVRISSFSG
ncbi:hypothetical protein D3C73_1132660 [compost metagenome]